MLVVRQAQWDALIANREADCMERLRGHLSDSFPREIQNLKPAEVENVIRLGMQRCASHGHETERDMYLYLTMMFMLGAYFDEDPQLAWVQRRLPQTRNPDPSRIDRLHNEALAYLDKVAGENNENLIRALVRVRAVDLASVAAVREQDLEEHLLHLLQNIYPAKFAVQTEAATRTVIRRGAELSVLHDMPGNEGSTVLAGLGFLMGHKFDIDPQYPWIQELLPRVIKGGGKARELHRRAMDFAARSLE